MNTVRICRFCQEKIHPAKSGSTAYCSIEHSKEARKQRSRARYRGISKGFNEMKRNENILSKLYFIKNDLKKEVSLSDLEKLHFNFGYSSEQKMSKNGSIWTIVGAYGYWVDPKTKIVDLWKRS